ncbi:MAG: DUF2330 domain-containing protein [Archangium sp.]|nr:DUF2330 domain-containing protein [Archangium sp.]
MRASPLLLCLALLAAPAHAFCGFYVSSAGGQLFNDATMVTLMRDGTRTVLGMQNNYRGPPEDFALIIPVPVILQKENVKTLPKGAFERIDALASPRLVEMYTDTVPCRSRFGGGMGMPSKADVVEPLPRDLGVKVEATFSVGEYDIVILSAKDALGLEIWLDENKYKIPAHAAPLLKPYVQTNWKFFVAKVNSKKVKFVAGQAVLSPLRFHYDSEKFELPVRLGLVNSSGSQDLIVHVIAKGRYEVANRPNITIPTNLDVKTSVKPVFGAFYADLVERTFKKNPTAAITEFAWQGALPPPEVMVDQGIYGVTCDPCPPPHPMDDPLARFLGADVLPGIKTDAQVAKFAREATLTRLHLRYSKDSLTDDLVFKQVEPIHGGVPGVAKAEPAKANRFQGRYVMWIKGSTCSGLGMGQSGIVSSGLAGTSAVMTRKTTLEVPIDELLVTDIPELEIVAKGKPPVQPVK